MNKTLRTLSTAAALAFTGTAAITASAATAGSVKNAGQSAKIKATNPSNTANGTTEIRLNASAGTVAYYSNGKFKSVYRERIGSGQVIQRFKFEVEAFTPLAEVPVILNGVQIGTTIVNNTGGGEFEFASVDNNPGDEQPLPSGFPRLRAGDTITIGNLTATFR